MRFEVPFHKGMVTFEVPDDARVEVLTLQDYPALDSPRDAVIEALRNPIMRPPLREVVKPGDKVCIIVQDITRLARSDVFLPPLLDELNSAGIKDEDMYIVFATGNHRTMTDEEHREIVGDEVFGRIALYDHKCREESNLKYVGTTSFGNDVLVNKMVLDADKIVVTGGIIYHYLAGFGGGRKCIVPGVAHDDTIKRNHRMFYLPGVETGRLAGNPINEELMEAVHMVKPHFLLNVVLNKDKEISGVFAGHYVIAHVKGTELVEKIYKVVAEEPADVVVASGGGFPRDVNFRQAHKSLDHAVHVLKPGGVMVFIAGCADGVGDAEGFVDWLGRSRDADELAKMVEKDYSVGGMKAYFVRKLAHDYKIIMHTKIPQDDLDLMGFESSATAQDAVDRAASIAGRGARWCIIPDASAMFPVPAV